MYLQISVRSRGALARDGRHGARSRELRRHRPRRRTIVVVGIDGVAAMARDFDPAFQKLGHTVVGIAVAGTLVNEHGQPADCERCDIAWPHIENLLALGTESRRKLWEQATGPRAGGDDQSRGHDWSVRSHDGGVLGVKIDALDGRVFDDLEAFSTVALGEFDLDCECAVGGDQACVGLEDRIPLCWHVEDRQRRREFVTAHAAMGTADRLQARRDPATHNPIPEAIG